MMTIGDPQLLHSEWRAKPTPEAMSAILESLAPSIRAEVSKYKGPKQSLRTKAKLIAVDAIKRYDPMSQAKLSTWVVSNMRSLNRYGGELSRASYSPEDAVRQAAEINSRRMSLVDELGRDPSDEELADHVGVSTAKLAKLRASVPAEVREGQMDRTSEDDEAAVPSLGGDDGGAARMREAVEAVRESLEERDRFILDARTGRDGKVLPAGQVARRLGLSDAMVSKRCADISGRIKKYFEEASYG